MSSNLLKQHYVITENDEKRVIDSNDRLNERLKAAIRSEAEGKKVSADGFTAGLPIADSLEPEAPRDYVAEARAEAEQILAEARGQAEEIIANANAEAQTILEEHKNRGYEEGKSRLEAEYAEKNDQLRQESSQKECDMEQAYQERFDTMEQDLIDAIIQVFDKVFHIQFEDKREILLYLTGQTIRQTETGNTFLIRVSTENRGYLEEHLDEIKARIGRNATLEIMGDVSFGDGDCRIETEAGVFDCGVDTQFQNLVKDIRSLCM